MEREALPVALRDLPPARWSADPSIVVALGQVQDFAHRVIGQERARGWSTQLENEATVMLGYERAWTGVAQGAFARNRYDVALRAGGMVGNALAYASVGVVLRYGENLP